MRISLPTTIIAIIIYESLLLGVRSRLMMNRATALSTIQSDWLETVPVPLWWWALAIVPPVLLIGYWAFRRSR